MSDAKTENARLWRVIERLEVRIEALEAHVRRLEESAPAPDSNDFRGSLPELGGEE